MASKALIPAEFRGFAAPDALLTRMGQTEANLRAKTVAAMLSAADGIKEPDIARATRIRAGQMRVAMPLREFQDAVRKRQAVMTSLGSGAAATELRAGYQESLRKLVSDNPYPPGLDAALDADVKAGRAKAPVLKDAKTQVTAAVTKALADLDGRIERLARDIENFKGSDGK